MFLVHAYDHKTHAHAIKSPSFDFAEGKMSYTHRIKCNLMQILAYDRYDMMHAIISSKHDNMHNDDMNYDSKLSKNNE